MHRVCNDLVDILNNMLQEATKYIGLMKFVVISTAKLYY